MEWWRRFHRLPIWIRLPLKSIIIVVATLVILFPRPDLMGREIARLRNPNLAIDPAHPGLAPLEQAVKSRLAGCADNVEVALAVEQVVFEALPYAWDWDTWWVMDYIPSVDEALRQGGEDCDGRAVVAASLLRRMGIPAELRSDLAHVWVFTPAVEVMGASSSRPAIEVTPQGVRIRSHRELARQAVSGLAFGVSVFPLVRELLLTAITLLVLLNPRVRAWRAVVAAGVMIAGLMLCRAGGDQIRGNDGILPVVGAAAGALLFLAGPMLLISRRSTG